MKRDGIAAVSIAGVSKAYGARRVLKDVHLTLRAGEFVAIVGRSGCGKSTLLRLVAGLEPPDRGRIAVAGQDHPAAASGTRMMFQDARLLPWKRVLSNVVLGRPGAESRQQGIALLRRVGLDDRARDWPAVLSGGQRQRVALARALLHSPQLMLLDEPLGALDALTRIEMQRLLESIWREQYFTALLVTHDVAEAVALADRVILLEGGTVAMDLQIGLPRPRRFDGAFAELEERILGRLLSRSGE